MGARQKLNSAAVLGSLATAAMLGCLTNSWLVLIIAAIVLLALSLYQGDIRHGRNGDW